MASYSKYVKADCNSCHVANSIQHEEVKIHNLLNYRPIWYKNSMFESQNKHLEGKGENQERKKSSLMKSGFTFFPL